MVEERREHEASRWWRLRFDPEQVAKFNGVADQSIVKSELHKAQRMSFFEGLARQDGSRMAIEVTSDERVYMDRVTGDVRAAHPHFGRHQKENHQHADKLPAWRSLMVTNRGRAVWRTAKIGSSH